MDSDQFDIEVPDTIPTYITRRHQKAARRVVTRGADRRWQGRDMPTWAWVASAAALIGAIVAMWTVWPSPTTFVVVPTIVLVAAVCVVTVAVIRRTGLDRI